jgi:hypothetical protein
MNPSTLKQLIAGFLLIAATVTSSALFLTMDVQKRPNVGLPNHGPSEIPANAFVELPDRTTEREVPKPGFVPNVFPENAVASDNLTDGLIALLGERIAEENPEGPTNPDGNLNLSALNANELADYFAQNAGPAAELPDWEREANAQHITVLTKYTTEDINFYNKQVNALLEFYGPQAAVLRDNITPTTAALQNLQFGEAYRRGTKIIVPEPVAGFHWSLMKLLAYQQKAVETARLAETDPVRAALIMQAQEQNYLAAIQLLVNESQRKTDIRGISVGELPFLANIVNQALGIRTAHAQWLVIDPADIARMVWEFLKKLATELLKDRLVHKLVQQTITWIQGGGKPQFVTNFKGFLTGVAEDEAGRMIEKFAPRLCQSFGPLVRVAVIPVNPARDLDVGPTCTLDQVVSNIRAFAQSFENGGWIAYGAALQPSNNFFGAMIQMSDIVDLESAKQREAKKTDVESSSGFLSSKECIKWTSECKMCLESIPSGKSCLCGTTGPPALSEENNICLEYRNTTPGETLVGAIKDSSAAPLLRIVNADDLAALANALINAALSKLVKLGASTVSKGLLGLDMGNYKEAADKCAGLTGEQLAACQKEWQDVNCTETTVTAPVNVGVTVDTEPVCITDPDTGVETCGGGGPASGTGSGSITFPNAADCTGGPIDPGGGGGGGGSCDGENCNRDDCLCKIRDGISPSDSCFSGDIWGAVDATIAAWRQNSPNGELDPSTGLIGAPYGNCQGSGTRPCVHADYIQTFKDAVGSRIGGGLSVDTSGDEVCVTGSCGKQTCSHGSPSDCRPGLQHAPGDSCVGPGTRRECAKLDSSQNWIMFNNFNSICPN